MISSATAATAVLMVTLVRDGGCAVGPADTSDPVALSSAAVSPDRGLRFLKPKASE